VRHALSLTLPTPKRTLPKRLPCTCCRRTVYMSPLLYWDHTNVGPACGPVTIPPTTHSPHKRHADSTPTHVCADMSHEPVPPDSLGFDISRLQTAFGVSSADYLPFLPLARLNERPRISSDPGSPSARTQAPHEPSSPCTPHVPGERRRPIAICVCDKSSSVVPATITTHQVCRRAVVSESFSAQHCSCEPNGNVQSTIAPHAPHSPPITPVRASCSTVLPSPPQGPRCEHCCESFAPSRHAPSLYPTRAIGTATCNQPRGEEVASIYPHTA